MNTAMQSAGTVFGLAVLTALASGITSSQTPPNSTPSPAALQAGYRAAFYGCVAYAAIGAVGCVLFVKQPRKVVVEEGLEEGGEVKEGRDMKE